MNIVKNAKYVGTKIGPEGHLHVGLTTEKFIQRARKINKTSKSLVERLIDFKMYALSVLGYIGSISTPDEATLKEESHALQCTTAGTHNAVPTDLLRAGSVWGLGTDICVIQITSPAARFRTASSSGTLVHGLAKIRAAREYDRASIYAQTPEW